MDLKFDLNINYMNPMKTNAIDLLTLKDNLLKGCLRIPEFQRMVVWSSEDVQDLLDSILNKYPIGFLLFWESSEELKERNPLKLKLRKKKRREKKLWLLDGQQRTVALVGSFTDKLFLGRKGNTQYRTFYDLKERKFNILKVLDIDKKKVKIESWFVALKDLITEDKNGEAMLNPKLETKYKDLYLHDLNHLFIQFSTLSIPYINEKKGLTEEACKIFEKLNSTGTPLTTVDLMMAKTYSKDFNLLTNIEKINDDLTNSAFELKDITILQCMSACVGKDDAKDTSKGSILKNSTEIKKEWDNTTQAIKSAIAFLKGNKICFISKTLPHEILLAPLTYFFYKQGNKALDLETNKALNRFFWNSIFSERYGRSQDTNAREDIKYMDELLNGKKDVFFTEPKYDVPIDSKTIKEENISSSPLAKIILCFLSHKEPKDYSDNSIVDVGKTLSDLSNKSMKNLHHVFPKNYLGVALRAKDGYGTHIEPFKDSMANISIISLKLNLEIEDKAPKDYLDYYRKKNIDIDKTLERHCIGELKEFGIKDDDFPKFLTKRSELIAEEIKKLLKSLEPITQKSP